MTNVQSQEAKKEKFVKYWELEEPTVLTTTKNEIRFFNQHSKIQVYPKIETGRGIGKGATINLDGFTQDDVELFKELYTEMSQVEIFETHKSYWDKEEPTVLTNESNEIRFYLQHGKIQVYPKISVGRGIGRGATINLDVPEKHRNEVNMNMFNMINSLIGVDFKEFEPVNEVETEVTNVIEELPTSSNPTLNEFELFQEYLKYSRMDEEEVRDLAITTIFSNQAVKNFAVNTLESYVTEEALSILNDELSDIFKPYNYKEMFKLSSIPQGVKAELIVDREFTFEWEDILFGYMDLHPELIEKTYDEVEENPSDEVEDGKEKLEEEIQEEHLEEDIEEDEEVVEIKEEEPTNSIEVKEVTVTSPPSNVSKMSNDELKNEYLKNSSAEKVNFKPSYTVELFEEMMKRKKSGKMI